MKLKELAQVGRIADSINPTKTPFKDALRKKLMDTEETEDAVQIAVDALAEAEPAEVIGAVTEILSDVVDQLAPEGGDEDFGGGDEFDEGAPEEEFGDEGGDYGAEDEFDDEGLGDSRRFRNSRLRSRRADARRSRLSRRSDAKGSVEELASLMKRYMDDGRPFNFRGHTVELDGSRGRGFELIIDGEGTDVIYEPDEAYDNSDWENPDMGSLSNRDAYEWAEDAMYYLGDSRRSSRLLARRRADAMRERRIRQIRAQRRADALRRQRIMAKRRADALRLRKARLAKMQDSAEDRKLRVLAAKKRVADEGKTQLIQTIKDLQKLADAAKIDKKPSTGNINGVPVTVARVADSATKVAVTVNGLTGEFDMSSPTAGIDIIERFQRLA